MTTTSFIETFDEYQDIVDDMPLYDDVLYGLITEVGEVVDIVKKGSRKGRSIDIEHLKEEIGDVLWYLSRTATEYGIDMSEVATNNVEKLNKRHQERDLIDVEVTL